ncbi:Grx4 family monothiol glutaredoxin [Haliangium ochraceum]|uniref:Probable monothiol glutaredoxin 2 n=1 Tax=Haliangium ochraceum (strain DSM 14365 / JCM 11303 / SMP-2) TaxID=502025 RepID=D0LZC3_HALO1|nr:Grx4 family monothiol glutaredoxin [Haliangium ochraceum]ACY16385.1 glutaredoxin-like protein [Haliangium ochraceum DSM 14365]
MSLDQGLKQRIESIIASDQVVLFMKGNRSFPQCGFSSTVVQILNSMVPNYTTVNVLADPEVRQGIKEFSDWPTIPQLYVEGEFVGGCDIVREMFENGELARLLGSQEVEAPTITITDAAAAALKSALSAEGGEGDVIHLAVDARFQHNLDLGPKTEHGIEVASNGVLLEVNRMSARLADGLTIDFVEEGLQRGFRMDNPNRPPEVVELSPAELKAKLDAGEIKELIDVRSPEERKTAQIADSRLLDDATMQQLTQLDVDTPLAFYCHRGQRSKAAAEHFRDRGFRKVYNLSGGIDAWSTEVDSDVPRY